MGELVPVVRKWGNTSIVDDQHGIDAQTLRARVVGGRTNRLGESNKKTIKGRKERKKERKKKQKKKKKKEKKKRNNHSYQCRRPYRMAPTEKSERYSLQSSIQTLPIRLYHANKQQQASQEPAELLLAVYRTAPNLAQQSTGDESDD